MSGGFSRAPGPGSGRGVAVFLGLTGALSESYLGLERLGRVRRRFEGGLRDV
jgi:hypothetical protein